MLSDSKYKVKGTMTLLSLIKTSLRPDCLIPSHSPIANQAVCLPVSVFSHLRHPLPLPLLTHTRPSDQILLNSESGQRGRVLCPVSRPVSTVRVQQYLHLEKVKYINSICNGAYLQYIQYTVYTTPVCQSRLCKADDAVFSSATELESSEVQPAMFE